MISRRALLAASLLAFPASPNAWAVADDENMRRALADLERRHGGRLGVAVLDTATMNGVAHRGGRALSAVQHVQGSGRRFRSGAGRSRAGEFGSPRRLYDRTTS